MATADELWDWLLGCLICGKVHEYRPESDCGQCGRHSTSWTWESPDDGHTYRSRGLNGDEGAKLRAEWNAQQDGNADG